MNEDFLENVLEQMHIDLQDMHGVDKGSDSFNMITKDFGLYFINKFLQISHVKREISYWKNHKNTDCKGWSLSYYLKGEAINSKSYNACLLDLAIEFLGENKVNQQIKIKELE